jgi:hypothetical protein
MKISVQLEAASEALSDVRYAWDADTDILSAHLGTVGDERRLSRSISFEGSDAWIILDVAAGRISGLDVAVWPEIIRRAAVVVPPEIEDASAILSLQSQAGQTRVSHATPARMIAEADPANQNFHFRLGTPRHTRTVRVARDLLLDVDNNSHITGLWLLNVPPCPDDS